MAGNADLEDTRAALRELRGLCATLDELVVELKGTKEALGNACAIQQHLNQSVKPIQAGFLKPTFTASLDLQSVIQDETD